LTGVRSAPVRLGVLYPPTFEPAWLDDVASRVDPVLVPYQDPPDVRIRKAAAHAGETPDPAGEQELSAAARAELRDAEVLLALDVPHDISDLAPKLRWVQFTGSGADHLLPALRDSGVVLTTATGAGAPGIAEFVFARLLQVLKQLRALDEQQAGGEWQPRSGGTLNGRTLGLVGLGAIGSEVAVRARAFGMQVIAVRKHPDAAAGRDLVDEVYGAQDLASTLPRCDVVVLAAPATPDTERLVDDAMLALLRDDAILCNVARGSLVDEVAVVQALHDGRLGAAILDVTDQEPLPPESPMWRAPRMFLSPHCAVSLDDYWQRVMAIFRANLACYLENRPLTNVVDADRGY
jgi:phosphoglycerate dehydrogenase-like enzyme